MNQGNVKKTWDGIRSLINVSKKRTLTPTKLVYKNKTQYTDKDIAESLNNFFVNIGSTVEEKIPKTQKTFFSFLKDPNERSLFLKEVTHCEILSFLNAFKSSKACGPNSIPTKFLLQCSEAITDPLVDIIYVT